MMCTYPAITPQKIEKLGALIANAQRIVITCHMSPDGDALGSSLGLAHAIAKLNPQARVNVVTPDEPPRYLRVIPGARNIQAWSSLGVRVEHKIAEADLIFAMDYNQLTRISRVAPYVRASNAVKVQIDHHLHPEDFVDLQFSQPECSSTCELLFEILQCLDPQLIAGDTATCLMAGMITDTGGFNYNSNEPVIFEHIATLMRAGVDKDWLMRCLVNTHSESSMRIESFAIAEKMQIFADHHAALITLSRDELNRFGYKKGDTEGLVNKPLAIPGIIYVAYLREESEYIKVSMRSLGDFPVNRLCTDYYGGGGHQNAAGGEFVGTLDECAQIFINSLDDNQKYITEASLKYANR